MSAHTPSPLKKFSLCLTEGQVEMIATLSRKTGLSSSLIARKLFPTPQKMEELIKTPEKLFADSKWMEMTNACWRTTFVNCKSGGRCPQRFQVGVLCPACQRKTGAVAHPIRPVYALAAGWDRWLGSRGLSATGKMDNSQQRGDITMITISKKLSSPPGGHFPGAEGKVTDQLDLHPKVKKRAADMPAKYRSQYMRAMSGKSLRAGVNSFCLECVMWQKEEVRHCTAPACPLYPYRPYR